MEYFAEYGLFLLKSLTIVAAILATVGGVLAISLNRRQEHDEKLEIKSLNEKYEQMGKAITYSLLEPAVYKQKMKAEKKAEKAEAKAKAKAAKREAKEAAKKIKTQQEGEAGEADAVPSEKKRLFVLEFDGDVKASAVEHMREEINAILTVASDADEILVKLESGGGAVHAYGLAASQLQRVRDKGVPLTVSVDRVAASGGYLMACVADKIIAAPFAIIGSIGVLAQIPNFNKVLKKNDIDFEQLTAGAHKRTLTMFGENTDAARQKMQSELEEVHGHFKDFVTARRAKLDINQVATGEYWLGQRAYDLGLVDALQTSDDYLMSAREDADLITVKYTGKQTLMEKLSERMSVMWRAKEKAAQESVYPRFM